MLAAACPARPVSWVLAWLGARPDVLLAAVGAPARPAFSGWCSSWAWSWSSRVLLREAVRLAILADPLKAIEGTQEVTLAVVALDVLPLGRSVVASVLRVFDGVDALPTSLLKEQPRRKAQVEVLEGLEAGAPTSGHTDHLEILSQFSREDRQEV